MKASDVAPASGPQWTRRAFLRTAAAVAASGSLGFVGAGRSSDARSGIPWTRIAGTDAGRGAALPALGLQSFSLRRCTLPELIDRLVELGIERVELIPEVAVLFYRLGSHFPVSDDGEEIDRTSALLAARGISISASGVHPVGDGSEAERLFRFALRAGIGLLTISPDDEALDALDRLCRAHPSVRLGIHNHGPWTRFDTIDDVERVLAGRAPNFGACVDTGHFIRSGQDPVQAIRRLGPRVQGVHLKDALDEGFFASGCLLGDGRLDLEGCLRALREIGFAREGALSIEYERDSDDLMGDLAACIARVEQAARAVGFGSDAVA